MNDIAFLTQEPKQEDYESQVVESKLLEIDELTSGDCFGDYAAILKESVKYSVVTIIPTEVFTVKIIDFIGILKEKFAEAFLKFSKPTPLDTELRKALIEMQKWSYYKNEVVMSVKANHINEKRNFDQ